MLGAMMVSLSAINSQACSMLRLCLGVVWTCHLFILRVLGCEAGRAIALVTSMGHCALGARGALIVPQGRDTYLLQLLLDSSVSHSLDAKCNTAAQLPKIYNVVVSAARQESLRY